jgi:hypothetical protein
MNYSQLTTYLKTTAGNHYNVVYAEAGYVEDLNWGENSYPMVMFVCQPGTFGINKIRYNMTMIVADVMDDQVLQQITKQSNMFDIGRDIINQILLDSQPSSSTFDLLEDSVVFTPFTDNLPDLCTGFQFDFVIEVLNINNCDLPFASGN